MQLYPDSLSGNTALVLGFFAVFFTSGVAVAHADSEQWQLLSVTAEPATAARLRDLPVMVEGGTQTQLHFQMRAQDRHLLEQRGIEHRVLVSDIAANRPTRSTARDPSYHTPEEVSKRLRQLAQQYPDIARVVDLGTSWQGRELTGLVVTDQPWTREPDEAALRILGAHHGDELASMEVSLAILELLLTQYANDPRIAAMVDGSELWFLPVVNPDGVVAYSRRNSRGVDLNRNYSYLWQPSSFSGEQPFSEVEADAVRTLSMTRSFFHGLSLHSGASNLGWVWNSTTELAADAQWMDGLCQDYLAATGQPGFWVTNGAQWYITYGDTNDWSYGVRGGHDYTLEVSVERAPDPSMIETLASYHASPSLDFLRAGFEAGIRGRVTDTLGRPLEAQILPGDPNWPTWADPETGAFARPLPPGNYELSISAQGHQGQSLSVAVPSDSDAAVELAVELAPTTDLVIEEALGLEQSLGLADTAQLCSTGLVAALSSEGRALLYRPGTGGPYELDWQESDGSEGDCLDLVLDPTVITEPWLREGEWHLLLEDGSSQLRAQLPLGVLLVSVDPGFILEDVGLQGPSSDLEIEVRGEDLPEGADIRFVGPAGQRRLPDARLGPDTAEQLRVQVDASDWANGLWSIRVFGNGHWSALSRILLVEEGTVTVSPDGQIPVQPIPRLEGGKGAVPQDDEPSGPPPPAAATGCTCSTSSAIGPRSLLLVLVLGLGIGYFRRT